MSKKHRRTGPVPTGNRSKFGPEVRRVEREDDKETPHGAPASEQDPKRRLGNFETAGEHAIEQPGGKQGANR